MATVTWFGQTFDTADLTNYGWYNTSVTVNSVSYPRLIGMFEAAILDCDASVTAAGTSETNAGTSATSAASSASAASTSASNASTSATNASNSAALASQWATTTGGQVAATDFSAKEWAIGTTATSGSSKSWATVTGAQVGGVDYSAKEYAVGDLTASGGSAKAWAQDAASPDGTTSKSAKTWAAEAAASAASVNLPTIQAGDASKQLRVKGDETGYELFTPSASGGGSVSLARHWLSM